MFQFSKMPARSAENFDFLTNFPKNYPIFQHLKQFFIFSPNISQNFPKFLEVVQNICHLRHVFCIPPLKFEIVNLVFNASVQLQYWDISYLKLNKQSWIWHTSSQKLWRAKQFLECRRWFRSEGHLHCHLIPDWTTNKPVMQNISCLFSKIIYGTI